MKKLPTTSPIPKKTPDKPTNGFGSAAIFSVNPIAVL
jgi:hypothetical protein